MIDDGWLVRGMMDHGLARVLAVDVTAAAVEVARAHGLAGASAEVAAEGVVATALLSAHIKGEERLTLQVQSASPQLAFVGDIDAEGGIRARLTPSRIPAGSGGVLRGMLLAIKHDARRELYRGATEVAGERLAAALERHLLASSQVAGAVRAGIRMDGGRIAFAGGVYVELLPALILGDDDGDEMDPAAVLDATTVEAALESLRAEGQVGGYPVEVLEERALTWRCGCSQERVEGMLVGLGADAVREILEEDGHAEVTCDFCRTTYTVDHAGLTAILASFG